MISNLEQMKQFTITLYVGRRTCNEGEAAEVGGGEGVVDEVLEDEVGVGVDQGQEGGHVERPVVEVEGAEEAERTGQQRPHPERAPVHARHCTNTTRASCADVPY